MKNGRLWVVGLQLAVISLLIFFSIFFMLYDEHVLLLQQKMCLSRDNEVESK